MFLDDSACNLASLNMLAFTSGDERPSFDSRGVQERPPSRAQARRHRPVRGEPPGGGGRQRAGHRRRRRRRGREARYGRTPLQRGRDPGAAAVRRAARLTRRIRSRGSATGVLGLHIRRTPSASQTWIEVMEQVPWRRSTERLDAPGRLRQALDREHVGRVRQKDQALDYLMVNPSSRGALGPPRGGSGADNGRPVDTHRLNAPGLSTDRHG